MSTCSLRVFWSLQLFFCPRWPSCDCFLIPFQCKWWEQNLVLFSFKNVFSSSAEANMRFQQLSQSTQVGKFVFLLQNVERTVWENFRARIRVSFICQVCVHIQEIYPCWFCCSQYTYTQFQEQVTVRFIKIGRQLKTRTTELNKDR